MSYWYLFRFIQVSGGRKAHPATTRTVAGVQWETDAALLGSVPVEHHSNQPPQLQASGWKTIQPEVSLLDDGHPLSTF